MPGLIAASMEVLHTISLGCTSITSFAGLQSFHAGYSTLCRATEFPGNTNCLAWTKHKGNSVGLF